MLQFSKSTRILGVFVSMSLAGICHGNPVVDGRAEYADRFR